MKRLPLLLFLLLTLAGAVRIALTWRPTSLTYDEGSNLACGMEYVARGTYTYGPFHPPAARIAMGIGPYLYGARPQGVQGRYEEGNAILEHAPNYATTLMLARAGILPFFLLATWLVWRWSRRLLGEWGALAPVLLFTNTPTVLAHAGLATTDMAVCAGVCAAVFAFTRWLEAPDARSSLVLGAAIALACVSKFSAMLLVPVSMAAVWGVWMAGRRAAPRPAVRHAAIALAAATLLVWGAYRFSWGPITDMAEVAPRASSLHARIPVPLIRVFNQISVPAPELIDGVRQVRFHVEDGHPAYLLGRNADHGWWYFFPVALAVKLPLGMLLLALAGCAALVRRGFRPFDWRPWAPAAAALAMLLAVLPLTINIGVRYLLPLMPMLAIVAGMSAVWLLRRPGRLWPAVSAVLMLWTAISSAAAHSGYIAYFNELAGREPERILVDSDLDWGQDMYRLAAALKARRVPNLHIACFYWGDLARLGLPPWNALQPYKPVTGWVAASHTTLKTKAWELARERGRSDLAFAWLDGYQPVERVGRSILLYYIPPR